MLQGRRWMAGFPLFFVAPMKDEGNQDRHLNKRVIERLAGSFLLVPDILRRYAECSSRDFVAKPNPEAILSTALKVYIPHEMPQRVVETHDLQSD